MQTSLSWHVITSKTVWEGRPHFPERPGGWQMRQDWKRNKGSIHVKWWFVAVPHGAFSIVFLFTVHYRPPLYICICKCVHVCISVQFLTGVQSFLIELDYWGSVLHDEEQWDFCSSFGSDWCFYFMGISVCSLDRNVCWLVSRYRHKKKGGQLWINLFFSSAICRVLLFLCVFFFYVNTILQIL